MRSALPDRMCHTKYSAAQLRRRHCLQSKHPAICSGTHVQTLT